MLIRVHAFSFFTVIFIIFLCGCSNNAEQASRILNADAGADITVKSGDAVVLDASNSTSGASVSYSWDIVGGPSDIVLFKGSLRNRHEEFAAPNVVAETRWLVELTIHDGNKLAKDQTEVTVMATAVGSQLEPQSSLVRVNLSASPNQGGTVEGGGEYTPGSNIIIKAIPKPGYGFAKWTENNASISTESTYQLLIAAPRELVAQFRLKGDGPLAELRNGDSQVTLSWPISISATSYNVYYAKESPVFPDNFGSLNGGSLILGITSSGNDITVDVSGLTNGIDYFFVVTSLLDNVESNPSRQLGARPRTKQPKRPKLNDTGITFCGDDNTNNLPCPVPNFSTQDAEYGRDSQVLNKTGNGKAGFDFSKIALDGSVLASDALNWDCVRDNVTGLWWEVKTANAGLRDMGIEYTWPSASVFASKVNRSGLCGFNDWRLPTRDELISIVDINTNSGPTVDMLFFSNTVSDGYWTDTSDPHQPGFARSVYFHSGGDGSSDINNSHYVRLVRGGPE